ncbi:transforming growth factor-beta-induced protein ig-h3-like [Varroa destructor]|uniref:FAS1 domain-containing protein n=2 Tax=Varroa TaxID=62624 RepID=A0A7M7K867_VARDE|nr:transforming growth factor-beta-induced protein ig-h3-like [Varroa destructor]
MHTPEVQPDIEIASGGPQYPFNPPGSVTPTSASTTTIRHPLPPQFELASRPSITLPMIANTTSAPTPIRPIATYKPPVATRSPMKRNSCVVEAPFCSSCLAKISSSEPWFPYPPPLFIPAVCSRCSILQVILNRLPEEVTVFSDILKLASFGEIVDFNEVLTEANGQVTVLAPSDAAFAYLPISIDDLKQRLVRSPNELRRFILYHLLPGYVTSRDLKPDAWIATCLFEKSIYINNDRQVNGAPLQSRDINHKHGSIHTLGRVLWPVAEDSVQLYLDANPFLSQFASWYRNFARVSKNDMVTVFAPTNAAFERVAPSIRKNLAKNDVLKARTVQKHIVPGLWFSSSISPSGAVLTPMDGLSVTCTAIKFEFNDPHKYQQKSGLSKADKLLTFGSSRVIASDQFVTNGVIHIVDKLNTDQLELCGFS